MKKELRCIVKGKVQGVMFRDFTKRRANRLKISGMVQNLPDGTVRVIAIGEEENLKKFLELLYKGPFLTRAPVRVDDIEAEWGEPSQDFSSFLIIY